MQDIYISLFKTARQKNLLGDISYIKLTIKDGEYISLKTYYPSFIHDSYDYEFTGDDFKDMVKVENVTLSDRCII